MGGAGKMGVDGNYDWGNREYFLTKNGIRSTAVNILKALKGQICGMAYI